MEASGTPDPFAEGADGLDIPEGEDPFADQSADEFGAGAEPDPSTIESDPGPDEKPESEQPADSSQPEVAEAPPENPDEDQPEPPAEEPKAEVDPGSGDDGDDGEEEDGGEIDPGAEQGSNNAQPEEEDDAEAGDPDDDPGGKSPKRKYVVFQHGRDEENRTTWYERKQRVLARNNDHARRIAYKILATELKTTKVRMFVIPASKHQPVTVEPEQVPTRQRLRIS